MKVNIGKNTIGDNDKMSVELREYNRSTHDLSYAWRSSMGVGMLVPCMKILGMPGDTFAIEGMDKIMTHPTVGPLLGSFKFQVDIFSCPIRLYNAMLHNNALNVGMDMKKVKLPKLMNTSDIKTNASSIFNYLGIKKFKANKKVNAVPTLCVFDIFKNYYANKQEDYFYILNNDEELTAFDLDETNGYGVKQKSPEQANHVLTKAEVPVRINTSITPDSVNVGNSIIRFTLQNGDKTLVCAATLGTIGAKLEYEDKQLIIRIPANSDFQCSGAAPREGTMFEKDAEITAATGLKLASYKLEEIDNLREEILSKGRQEYVIASTGGNCNIQFMKDLVTNLTTGGALYGLPLKTHFSDIFNNWVKTEWVEGDNGIAALTAIDTSGGSFTIDTLNLAEKVYNLLNRIAISGGSYKDWIETVWTTDYYFRAETPVYEGGMSSEVEFDEVVSTSATEITNNEPLGTLAGKGVGTRGKGGTVTVKVNEPCYIIGIASITPRVDYSQGNDWDNDLDTLDDIHKPQLDGIGYQDLLQKWMHADANEDAAVGKTVAWINYMTNVNRTYGNFAVGGSESFMVLNRIYTVGSDGEIENSTTYINPKEFTGTFATNDLSNQDFWVQLGFKIEARRVMSAKQIPLM